MHLPRHARWSSWVVRLGRALGWTLREEQDDAVARAGEDEAVRLLQATGCEVLARNAMVPFGEADVICREASGIIVIVEVKARLRRADASAKSQRVAPGASITSAKRRKLARIANYLKARNGWAAVRIDAVSVELTQHPDGSLHVLSSRRHAGIARG